MRARMHMLLSAVAHNRPPPGKLVRKANCKRTQLRCAMEQGGEVITIVLNYTPGTHSCLGPGVWVKIYIYPASLVPQLS